MDNPPVLRTERLTLRPALDSDAPPLARLANDLEVVRMTSRMPYPYVLADAEAFVARTRRGDPSREATWVLDRAGDPIGVLGFFTAAGAAVPEIGYWLGRPAWGQGFATEAARTAISWCDAVWRKRAITACCFTDNAGSPAVLEKCGFLTTGVIEPGWSLARGVYAPSRFYIRLP